MKVLLLQLLPVIPFSRLTYLWFSMYCTRRGFPSILVSLLSIIFLLELPSRVVANKEILKFLARIGSKLTKRMGQAVRMIQYDRAANERNAIPALKVSDVFYMSRGFLVWEPTRNSI